MYEYICSVLDLHIFFLFCVYYIMRHFGRISKYLQELCKQTCEGTFDLISSYILTYHNYMKQGYICHSQKKHGQGDVKSL
jgi:hypothetical protein